MALACPQCKQIYDHSGVCPLCNVVLLFHADSLRNDSHASRHDEEDEAAHWQQTPWGKILIGLILAQGLSFGLLQLLTAGFLASGDTANVWTTLWGIVLRHTVSGLSLILGGAVTGAGQRRGIIYGSFVGLASGIVSMMIHERDPNAFVTFVAYLEPLIHLATGAIGGAVGMLIWRPIPTMADLGGNTPVPSLGSPFGASFARMFAGPVYFGRVCAGAFVIVIGFVWANSILEFVLRASNGTLTISSQLQAQLVSMEISAMVALLGASFAGATTRNGIKQGMCAGLAAGAIVLGIQIGSPKLTLESVIFTFSAMVIIALVGGWFGSQLFPPLSPKRKRGLAAYD
jgi:hypothetical protein